VYAGAGVPNEAEGGGGVDREGAVKAALGCVEYGSNVGVCSVEVGGGAGETGASVGVPVSGGAGAVPKPC
jgi:hypothetical protein